MTKLVVALCLCVLLGGTALYLGGSKVSPGVSTKANSLNTAITNASVSPTTGTATMTAP